MGFKNIGERIQQARDEAGLTQAELSRRLGITQAALSNYELGKRRLYLHQIQEIADLLGRDLNYFIQDETRVPQQQGEPEPATILLDDLTSEEIDAVHSYIKFLKWSRTHAH